MARVIPGACGEAYRHLAVTVDGYTLDNPYGNFAVWTDVNGWRTLARSLLRKCRDHYNVLGEIERMRKEAKNIPDESDYPQWNALNEQFNAMVAKVNELEDQGGKWTGGAVIEAIAFCTDLVADELCFLELVDAAISSYGVKPPKLPGTVKPAPPPGAAGKTTADVVIKLGLAAIAAYAIVQVVKKP